MYLISMEISGNFGELDYSAVHWGATKAVGVNGVEAEESEGRNGGRLLPKMNHLPKFLGGKS